MAALDPSAPVSDALSTVIGWRCWDVDDDGRLISPLRSSEWPARRAMVARCEGDPGDICGTSPRVLHPVPFEWCGCGLYALRVLPAGYARRNVLLGCVALWGTVVEGEYGWRAEYGYPVVLFAPPSFADVGRKQIADAYGVPVLGLPVEPDALAEFGDADLRSRAEDLRDVAGRDPRYALAPAAERFVAEARRVAPEVRATALAAAWEEAHEVQRDQEAAPDLIGLGDGVGLRLDEVPELLVEGLERLLITLAALCAAAASVLIVLGIAGVV